MSIVITPTGRPRGEPTQLGRLAASLLSVTVAGLADPQRFRRGKTYLLDRAVVRLELSEGVLLGTVAGGRPEPYQVTVTVETLPRLHDLGQALQRGDIARLIPRGDELLCTCTCPDWDDPCKHGVATLLALAAELNTRPELLATWRHDDGEEGRRPRTKVGSRGRSGRHLRLVPPTPPSSPFETPEWRDFVGTTAPIPACTVSDKPLVAPPIRLDDTDVTAVICSAWQTLARFGAREELP